LILESFSVSDVIPAEPERIYSAWLDAASHSAFTGEEATFEPFVGGRHTAFGGYSEGTNLELLPGRRIVQSWRAKDFPEGSPDSRLEVTLEETLGGTVVTILHSEIPGGQSERYREGWVKFYLEPLKQFFAADDAASAGPTDEDSDEGDEDDEDEEDDESTVESPPPLETAVPAKPKRAAAAPSATAKAAARKPAKRAVAKAAKPTRSTGSTRSTRSTRSTKKAAKATSAVKKTSAARRAAAPKAKAKPMKVSGKAKPKAAAKKKPAKRRK
jgi:uncharacterized protein YndB with AHSA1/START domain